MCTSQTLISQVKQMCTSQTLLSPTTVSVKTLLVACAPLNRISLKTESSRANASTGESRAQSAPHLLWLWALARGPASRGPRLSSGTAWLGRQLYPIWLQRRSHSPGMDSMIDESIGFSGWAPCFPEEISTPN